MGQISRDMMRYRLSLLLILLAATASSADSRPRYAAMLADGTRIEGDDLSGWHETGGTPRLNGRPLLNAANPLRWLRDRRLSPPGKLPDAFVEFIGGDRLPGTVVGYRASNSSSFEPMPAHFIIRPDEQLRLQITSDEVQIRVLARFVQRIVLARRDGLMYEPATVFYRDGRKVGFRAVRFSDRGVTLLLPDGTQKARLAEIAEIHMPRQDAWDAHFDALTLLSPDAATRLLEIETTAGLVATGSLERLSVTVRGNPKDPDRWVHGIQPAWSLDLLWIYNGDIWMRRTMAPNEVPLVHIAPDKVEQRSLLGGTGFAYRINRNSRGGLLKGGGEEFSWGLGVHALSRLTFPLPACATVFRSRFGLDAIAGQGGCVRGKVYLDGTGNKPMFDSGIVIGSKKTIETGDLKLPLTDGEPRQLVLEVDPTHRDRPRGADPLDIRDTANWLDPLIVLDRELLAQEIAARASAHLPAWQGWNLAMQQQGTLQWENAWDDLAPAPGAFTFGVKAIDKPFALRRRQPIGQGQNWLVLMVSRAVAGADLPAIEVRIGGEEVGAYEIPLRDKSHPQAAPLAIPLEPYQSDQGEEVEIEITQTVGRQDAAVRWQAIRITEHLPTLYRLFDDDGAFEAVDPPAGGTAQLEDGDAHSGSRSIKVTPASPFRRNLGGKIAVRRDPGWGEFRYVRFAFRKFGEGRICLELGHADSKDNPVRYDAGLGDPCFGKARRVWVQRLPSEWIVMTRDLFAEFGEFDAESLVLCSPDGEHALFDHIYLARTQEDFELIPVTVTAEAANEKARQELARPLLETVRAATVMIDFGDDRWGTGTIIDNDGEVITAGHLVIAPDRQATVYLSDGRKLQAKTRGVFRERDLGMLKITDEGVWPFLSLAPDGDVKAGGLRVAAAYSTTSEKREPVIQTAEIRRVFRGAIWTDYDVADVAAGGPVADEQGRLLGVHFRRSRFGGFLYSRVTPSREIVAQLREGKVWGQWQPHTGPVLGLSGQPVKAGFEIKAVPTDSPAAKAGIGIGDVIRRCQGKSIVSLDDIDDLLRDNNPGDEITLEIRRGDKTMEARLKLAPRLP